MAHKLNSFNLKNNKLKNYNALHLKIVLLRIRVLSCSTIYQFVSS